MLPDRARVRGRGTRAVAATKLTSNLEALADFEAMLGGLFESAAELHPEALAKYQRRCPG